MTNIEKPTPLAPAERVQLITKKTNLTVEQWKLLAATLPNQAWNIINGFLNQIENASYIPKEEIEQTIQTLKQELENHQDGQDLVYLLTVAIWNTYGKAIVKDLNAIDPKIDWEGTKQGRLLNEQARVGAFSRQLSRLLAGYDITNPKNERMLYNLLTDPQQQAKTA